MLTGIQGGEAWGEGAAQTREREAEVRVTGGTRPQEVEARPSATPIEKGAQRAALARSALRRRAVLRAWSREACRSATGDSKGMWVAAYRYEAP